MIAVALKWWRETLIVVLILFAVVMWERHNTALVERGRALERARVADSTLSVLRPALAHTDTVLVHDTVTLTRLAHALTTIHDTVLRHLTDTVLVKQFISMSDSTIHACNDLLSSCVLFRAQATATIAALTSKVAALPALAPRSCVPTGAVWALIGAGTGFLGGRLAR